MGYSDIFIPLAVGLLLIFGGGKFINPKDPGFHRKKKNFLVGGCILLGIALLYTIITFTTRKNCITC
jgi:hypothetical protein